MGRTFCVNSKKNLLHLTAKTELLQLPTRSSGDNSSLSSWSVPGRAQAGSLCPRQKGEIKNKESTPESTTEEDYRETETEDTGQLTGQDGVSHNIPFFLQLVTHTRCNAPSLGSKDQDGNDKRSFPTNCNCLGKLNLLHRICPVDSIWKSATYQRAVLFTGSCCITKIRQAQFLYHYNPLFYFLKIRTNTSPTRKWRKEKKKPTTTTKQKTKKNQPKPNKPIKPTNQNAARQQEKKNKKEKIPQTPKLFLKKYSFWKRKHNSFYFSFSISSFL